MNVIIGIDLGTTNSLVAVMKDGQPIILAPEGERNIVPSVVSFQSGQVNVGDEALPGKTNNSRNTIFSIKRLNQI